MKPDFSCQKDTVGHKQRRVTLWVTMATPTGIPGVTRTKGLWVDIVLSSPSFQFPTSKPTSPADRGVK
ncbi:hypothetical protein GBF38_015686 [Scomber scombrus]